jgi:hypothetical protein
MNPARIARRLAIAVAICLFSPLINAIQPTWARKAVAFPSECGRGSGAPASWRSACKSIRIPSPDRRFTVEVYYQRVEIEKNFDMLVAYFSLRSRDGTIREGSFPYGFQNIDLLWSPDSKAFFVNGGNGSATAGFWVYIYGVDDPNLEPRDITHPAQDDMLKAFPPCRASELDQEFCKSFEKQPEFNMSGIDWAGNSSALIVMAEVPEGGGMGGIKGQVMGYELDAATGAILQRIPAPRFKQAWQPSLAFRFHVPQPPEYCEKGNPRQIPGCIGHDW